MNSQPGASRRFSNRRHSNYNGQKLIKLFEGHGFFEGTVQYAHDVACGQMRQTKEMFRVLYEDGDEEDMTEEELGLHIKAYTQRQKQAQQSSSSSAATQPVGSLDPDTTGCHSAKSSSGAPELLGSSAPEQENSLSATSTAGQPATGNTKRVGSSTKASNQGQKGSTRARKSHATPKPQAPTPSDPAIPGVQGDGEPHKQHADPSNVTHRADETKVAEKVRSMHSGEETETDGSVNEEVHELQRAIQGGEGSRGTTASNGSEPSASLEERTNPKNQSINSGQTLAAQAHPESSVAADSGTPSRGSPGMQPTGGKLLAASTTSDSSRSILSESNGPPKKASGQADGPTRGQAAGHGAEAGRNGALTAEDTALPADTSEATAMPRPWSADNQISGIPVAMGFPYPLLQTAAHVHPHVPMGAYQFPRYQPNQKNTSKNRGIPSTTEMNPPPTMHQLMHSMMQDFPQQLQAYNDLHLPQHPESVTEHHDSSSEPQNSDANAGVPVGKRGCKAKQPKALGIARAQLKEANLEITKLRRREQHLLATIFHMQNRIAQLENTERAGLPTFEDFEHHQQSLSQSPQAADDMEGSTASAKTTKKKARSAPRSVVKPLSGQLKDPKEKELSENERVIQACSKILLAVSSLDPAEDGPSAEEASGNQQEAGSSAHADHAEICDKLPLQQPEPALVKRAGKKGKKRSLRCELNSDESAVALRSNKKARVAAEAASETEHGAEISGSGHQNGSATVSSREDKTTTPGVPENATGEVAGPVAGVIIPSYAVPQVVAQVPAMAIVPAIVT